MAATPYQYMHRPPPRWQFLIVVNGEVRQIIEEHRVVSGQTRLVLEKDDTVQVLIQPYFSYGKVQPIQVMPGSTVTLEKVRQFR